MKKSAFYFLIILFASLTIFSGCKKDGTGDATAAIDNAIAESESNRMIQAINTSADDNDIRSPQELDSILPVCAVVTIDTSNSIRTITIDFGTTPCKCDNWDGKYREGKIIASWTGLYRDSATVITFTTENYFAGYDPTALNKFEYLKTVTNMGHNANGNLHYAVNVITAIVTLPDGKTITWTSQRDREWIAGESTLLAFDDQYSITGAASGTDRNGNPFTVTITNALIVKLFCPWISQGTLDITHGNLPTAILDYGNGECDNEANITINGNTTTITLG